MNAFVATLIAIAVAAANPTPTQYSIEFVIAQGRSTHGESAESLAKESNQGVYVAEPVPADMPGESFDRDRIVQDGYIVLSAPSITTLADSEATIRVGGEQPLQYFEALGDNRYELKESDEAPFVEFGAIISKGSSDTGVTMQMHYSVAVVASRAPVEGTSLPIGKPDIRKLTEKFDEAHIVPLNTWMVMNVQDDRGAETSETVPVKMAVYFRVTEKK